MPAAVSCGRTSCTSCCTRRVAEIRWRASRCWPTSGLWWRSSRARLRAWCTPACPQRQACLPSKRPTASSHCLHWESLTAKLPCMLFWQHADLGSTHSLRKRRRCCSSSSSSRERGSSNSSRGMAAKAAVVLIVLRVTAMQLMLWLCRSRAWRSPCNPSSARWVSSFSPAPPAAPPLPTGGSVGREGAVSCRRWRGRTRLPGMICSLV
mmetsp:Transcript_25291/g.65226  ORF Transcript_25291/g.65226 Transcript_25291/m.65226 type:complete len:208 (+) Transcript_25291:480-1103(+)